MDTKLCTDCGKTKPVDEFHSGGRHARKYTPFCKECAKSEHRRSLVRKRVAEYQKRKKDDPEYKAKRNAMNQKIRSTESGRAMCNMTTNRSKERRLLLDSSFTKDDALFIHKQFNYRCFKCGDNHGRHKTIDHHYPVSKGHALTIDNAVLLCRSCNSSKKSRMPEEFYTLQELATLVEVYHKIAGPSSVVTL